MKFPDSAWSGVLFTLLTAALASPAGCLCLLEAAGCAKDMSHAADLVLLTLLYVMGVLWFGTEVRAVPCAHFNN
jgi:hypothetical protein